MLGGGPCELAERFRASDDPAEAKQLGDELAAWSLVSSDVCEVKTPAGWSRQSNCRTRIGMAEAVPFHEAGARGQNPHPFGCAQGRLFFRRVREKKDGAPGPHV